MACRSVHARGARPSSTPVTPLMGSGSMGAGQLRSPTPAAHAWACHAERAHRRRSMLTVRAAGEMGEGPTGLNVDGARPTSPRGWSLMMQALKEAKVRLVSSQELLFDQAKGHVVVDIRPEAEFDKGHIPGSVNVPFYQPISGWSSWQVVRRVAFAAFGVLNGTEVNPNFVPEIAALAEGGKPVILYCSMGGHLDPISVGGASVPREQELAGEEEVGARSNKRKVQTRSMIAAYQLLQKGYADISILKGGFSEWRASGRDVAVIEQ